VIDILASLRTLTLPANAGPNDPAIVLGDEIPPELVTFYGGTTIISAIIFRKASNLYGYIALLDLLGVTPGMAHGIVVGGTVTQIHVAFQFFPSDAVWQIGSTSTNPPTDVEINASGGGSVVIGCTIDAPLLAPIDAFNATDDLAFTQIAYQTNQQCGLVFTAPASGTVMVMFNVRMESNTAGVRVLASPELAEGNVIGSGTVVLVATDSRCIESANQGRIQAGNYFPVTGLTPGDEYNVELQYKVSTAGNGDMFDQRVTVLPWIG
jgi:hypothetical protein